MDTATRSQTDAEIITALHLELPQSCTITLDRSDPYRVVVIGDDHDGQGERYIGRAILASVDGTTARRWHLGCLTCDTEITVEDAAACGDCRELMAD